MKTYFISASTFCMERMLDCQQISDYLKLNGWRPVTRVHQAGLVIISTCSFGREEDASSLDYIRYFLKKKSPRARFLIMGCLSVINPGLLSPYQDIPVLTPTTLSRIETLVPPEQTRFADVPEPNKISAAEVTHSVFLKKALSLCSIVQQGLRDFKPGLTSFRRGVSALKGAIRYIPVMKAHINPFLSCNRNGFYYLRLSKGCLGNCSYCAKKHSTGTLHSKPPAAILDEFRAGLKATEKQFYLLTEDVGCYGADQHTDIVSLLKDLFEAGERHDFRVVLSNFNARWFVRYYEDLEPLLTRNQEKILYLQIPIQSGSTRILEFMSRHYTIEDVRSRLLTLKKNAPAIAFTTDIIAGFPGETEDDFELTKKFLQEIQFKHVDIFAYEKRPGTKAERLPGDVPPAVIRERVLQLARLQNRYNKGAMVAKKMLDVTRENLQRYRNKSVTHTP